MRFRQIVYVAIVSLTLTSLVSVGQNQQRLDEVIRITTDLVQTAVVVVDKQGRFVDGLRQDQFILKVDGQQLTPTFLEQVVTGTAGEEKLERSVAQGEAPATTADSSYRGRTIIFFIDDLHLSADSVQRTKKGILDFVELEMSLEDQVAVVSPSGQIGFLQRLSDLKPVLRAAVNRLTYKPYTVRDHEQIRMTEYQAIRIDQGDSAATDYFVTELLKVSNFKVQGGIGPPPGGPAGRPLRGGTPTAGMTHAAAKRVVEDRANLLVRQSESVTNSTLSALESLMRSVTQLPGRKVVFLVTDGFFLNDRSTGYGNKVRRIVDAAVRGGLVIYSLDARGVVSMTDAGSNRVDPEGRLGRANIGELTASQEGLNALAVDSGGKAFYNSTLTTALKEALAETANYYLLSWRPNTQEQMSPNFRRIEVSIAGRPELQVRVPRGYFITEPKAHDKEAEKSGAAAANDFSGNSSARQTESALISALSAPSARIGVPTKLSVSFVDVPGSGTVLSTATQVSTNVLNYGADGNQPARVDLAGVVLNDQGKQAGSFKTRLNVAPLSSSTEAKDPAVVYNHKVPLKPGLYQVRVAVHDEKSGRVGSAAQWIEIPDVSSKKLMMATLLLGGAGVGSTNVPANKDRNDQVQFSVDRRFSRESQMTLFTLIYNARPTDAGPNLESQIEILRRGQRVIASPVRPIVIEPNTDLSRIPYGAAVALKTLVPGRYVLRVTINDRNANEKTVNEVLFDVSGPNYFRTSR